MFKKRRKHVLVGISLATVILMGCQKDDIIYTHCTSANQCGTQLIDNDCVHRNEILQLLARAKSEGLVVYFWAENGTLHTAVGNNNSQSKDTPDATFKTEEEAAIWAEELAFQGINVTITYNDTTGLWEGRIQK
jgi:hypothetical protein